MNTANTVNKENTSTVGKKMLSESKFYGGYSRWDEDKNRYETWEEAVSRVMQMHRTKYADKMTPELDSLLALSEKSYKEKKVLGAQRALQFGGDQLLRKEMRNYNCTSSYADRPRFFQEAMWMLLCGAGVGFSVQKQHIAKLPKIHKRYEKKVKVFTIPDSIEGWADSFGVLFSSYFEGGGTFPEYEGCQVHFDFSKIRPKGALISGGFKAPGSDGLREALLKCEKLLDREVKDSKEPVAVRSIVAYDFVMYMSDAVLSGGIRRAATICLFSKDDTEMLNAKTGDWFIDQPQRSRSNNSIMIERDNITRDEWNNIIKSVKQVGEPGFIFTDNLEFTYNPLTKLAA